MAEIIKPAFKEWSSVVDALGSGKQIIILRRGGIIEDEGDFTPKEKVFWLFPTTTHEKPELLKEYRRREDGQGGEKGRGEEADGDTVKINFWAEVVFAKKIESEDTVRKLEPFHIWKEEVVLERFHRWEKDEVWLLAVRVFRLKEPISIKMKPEYGGCKSWIEIEIPESKRISELIKMSEPVLPDDEFRRKLEEIKKVVGDGI